MKHIAILATDNCVGSQAMGVLDFFHFCNSIWQAINGDKETKLFTAALYSINAQITCSNGYVLPCRPIDTLNQVDAIAITAGYANDKVNLLHYLEQMRPFQRLISRQSDDQTMIMSYCSGTFALAQAGLLNNKKATTVWWLQKLFSQQFPLVELCMDQLVVDTGTVITAGATTAYLNACIKLVEKLIGIEFAMQVSKVLLIDRHRLSQMAFTNPHQIIINKDSLVDKVSYWMLKHYQQQSSLDQIADQFATTKRTLIRRFKAATGDTPLHYLQKIRVEKAKELLESTNLAVERIVEHVGYEDAASFRKLFIGHTQLTPKQYRQRFSHSVAL